MTLDLVGCTSGHTFSSRILNMMEEDLGMFGTLPYSTKKVVISAGHIVFLLTI